MFAGQAAGFHAIVATNAVIGDGAVINTGWLPSAGRVATVARQRSDDMRRTFAVFGEIPDSVVAGLAHRDAGLGMVKFDRWFPLARRLAVAGVAHVAGAQTGQMFACHHAHIGKASNMAAGAVAGKTSVVDRGGLPTGNRMAGVARLGGRHVGRHALTRRQGTVVAGRAHGDAGLGVVKLDNRFPLAGSLAVARFADVAGG